jgi:flagellar assembly protein FliH
MSVFGYPDAPTTAPRKLRRLSHLPAVSTTYLNRNPEAGVDEAAGVAAAQQGYEDGYAEGLARAEAEAAELREGEARRAAAALAALARAIAAVADAERAMKAEIEEAAPKLAFALVETLLGREVLLAVNPGREAIARALTLDQGMQPATVRLHPGDVAALGTIDLARDVNVVADPAVEPGCALVDIGRATLDGQLGTALERVRQVLLGPAPPGSSDDRAA